MVIQLKDKTMNLADETPLWSSVKPLWNSVLQKYYTEKTQRNTKKS